MLFVVLYKLTDTFAGVMTGPFVLDIGFDKASYAAIVKGVGLTASLLGGFAGGLLARALPLSPRAAGGGLLQALANFTFSWLAWLGGTIWASPSPSRLRISPARSAPSCSSPIYRRSAPPRLYRDAICPAYRAFLVRPHPVAAITGFIVEAVGWMWFFVLCAAAAIPAMLLWC